jgi:hypothetical protein
MDMGAGGVPDRGFTHMTKEQEMADRIEACLLRSQMQRDAEIWAAYHRNQEDADPRDPAKKRIRRRNLPGLENPAKA